MLKVQNKEEMINETSLREGNTSPRLFPKIIFLRFSGKVILVPGRQWHNHDDRDTFGMVFNEYKRNFKVYPFYY